MSRWMRAPSSTAFKQILNPVDGRLHVLGRDDGAVAGVGCPRLVARVVLPVAVGLLDLGRQRFVDDGEPVHDLTVQKARELGVEVRVERNDQLTVDEAAALAPVDALRS